ncbi:hypothetical protein PoB_001015300 [Plakobranchus ocellatus]|uniref:Uncharacterized protein n=1 Tax=Plakobranchus ocellatus TaxID=259542 RepID=A0AAV3YMZ1_9GAST|nr:hypothetical protein PoB_001015300 [Plakobranchus ocellatus]
MTGLMEGLMPSPRVALLGELENAQAPLAPVCGSSAICCLLQQTSGLSLCPVTDRLARSNTFLTDISCSNGSGVISKIPGQWLCTNEVQIALRFR